MLSHTIGYLSSVSCMQYEYYLYSLYVTTIVWLSLILNSDIYVTAIDILQKFW